MKIANLLNTSAMRAYGNLACHLFYPHASAAIVLILGLVVTHPTAAQESAPPQPNPAEQPATPLADEQDSLAKQFGDLETLLLKLSEIESDTNPMRASLLQRASKLGKESSVQSRLREAAKALQNKQFSRAIEEQQATKESLEKLLELLLSEDRDDRVREEKKKVEELIKEIQRLNRLQRSLRGRTESTDKPEELAEDQKGLEKKADEIAQELSDDESSKPETEEKPTSPNSDAEQTPAEQNAKAGEKEAESKPGESSTTKPDSAKDETSKAKDEKTPGEQEPKESPNESMPEEASNPQDMPKKDKPSESPENKENAPADNSKETQPKESEPSESESSKQSSQEKPKEPSDSQNQPPPMPGQQSESQPSQEGQQSQQQDSQQQQPQQPQTPQQRVEQAKKRMEEARKRLENAEKEKAIEEQKAAEEELRQAAEELEQILRQLREEEIERSLVQLEARFRRMLEMQIAVNEETTKLDRIAGDQRERAWEQRVANASQEERKIIAEADRALLLLREEGTSLAFPEAGEQLMADMEMVAQKLDTSDVGVLTQTIQAEIVAGLEEVLEALTAAQRANEKKKKEQEGNPPPPPQPGSPEQQPLVDALAELRLIRTLQMRINTRTSKLSELMGTKEDVVGQAEEGEMRQQIRDLSVRQQKLQQITRDIVVGRNQ